MKYFFVNYCFRGIFLGRTVSTSCRFLSSSLLALVIKRLQCFCPRKKRFFLCFFTITQIAKSLCGPDRSIYPPRAVYCSRFFGPGFPSSLDIVFWKYMFLPWCKFWSYFLLFEWSLASGGCFGSHRAPPQKCSSDQTAAASPLRERLLRNARRDLLCSLALHNLRREIFFIALEQYLGKHAQFFSRDESLNSLEVQIWNGIDSKVKIW